MTSTVVYRGEDGFWVAECPGLPGCISQGRTFEEAVSNIQEAIAVYIDSLREDALQIPAEYSFGDLL